MAEYRITYSIERKAIAGPEEPDSWVEIGFGGSGAWDNVEGAVDTVVSDVVHRRWETEAGMPAPSEVDGDGDA